MADIFLSYAREDAARVEQIANALAGAGYSVFWDKDIPPGKSWADLIEGQLSGCKAAIVVWSVSSVASKWVREEARLAQSHGKLLPVAIDEAPAPLGFGEIQSADLKAWDGRDDEVNWRRLVAAVAATVGAPTHAAQVAPRFAPVAKRWRFRPSKRAFVLAVAGVVALFAVVTAIGLWQTSRPAVTAPSLESREDARPAPSTNQTNLADELTDFGVPPQRTLQREISSETPTDIPGAVVVTTAQLRRSKDALLLIDVLPGDHTTIPGAIRMPGMGDYGTFNDRIQRNLESQLEAETDGNLDRFVVFFCAGAKCWESYNAALRAMALGYRRVGWYRGGLASWDAAGLPVTRPGPGG